MERGETSRVEIYPDRRRERVWSISILLSLSPFADTVWHYTVSSRSKVTPPPLSLSFPPIVRLIAKGPFPHLFIPPSLSPLPSLYPPYNLSAASLPLTSSQFVFAPSLSKRKRASLSTLLYLSPLLSFSSHSLNLSSFLCWPPERERGGNTPDQPFPFPLFPYFTLVRSFVHSGTVSIRSFARDFRQCFHVCNEFSQILCTKYFIINVIYIINDCRSKRTIESIPRTSIRRAWEETKWGKKKIQNYWYVEEMGILETKLFSN